MQAVSTFIFVFDAHIYFQHKLFRVIVDKSETLPEKKKSTENSRIDVIVSLTSKIIYLQVVEYGEMPPDVPLQLFTTYPNGAGFPFFTWAQLVFTNASQVIFIHCY
ncbi:MAG: hypothetical protein DI548_02910 [Flavobacterium johnsoniae]|nr:MAG: hypothetical protein DI548_02910 [Flavobacterium johnsoniae]